MRVLSQLAAPYARSAGERAAGITPTYYGYREFNVLRYGADDTGANDSTAAFTACGSTAANPTCIVPPGTYQLASNPTPSGTVLWVLYGNPTFTGPGVLPGHTVSFYDGVSIDGVPVTTFSNVDQFTASAGQTVFALSDTPLVPNAALVVMNGALLTPTTDYTISGSTLTLVNGALAGQTVVARY
jgi:hypothetical protein